MKYSNQIPALAALAVSAMAHAGDTPADATPFVFGETLTGSTVGNSEALPVATSACGSYFTGSGPDAFHSFSLAEESVVSLSLCGSSFDTDLSVHDASSLSLMAPACDDDSCGSNYESTFSDVALPAGDYIIRVGGYFGDTGNYFLDGTATAGPGPCEGNVPANDLFENAAAMDLNGQVTGSTQCAGGEATFGDQCDTNAFTGDGPDVFYSISLAEAGTIDLWTCASDYDTDLSIHNMDGSIVVCDGDGGDDDAADGCVEYASRINIVLQAGDYVVRIGGYEAETGNYVLDSSFVAGDPCAGDPPIFNVSSVQDFNDQLIPLADLCPGATINWAPGVYNWGSTISLGSNDGVIHRGSTDINGDPTTIFTGDNQRQILNSFGAEAYENMIFENGVAGGDGGAFILSPSGKVTFQNCIFRNNTSGSNGGAVCNLGAQNGSEFIDCLFVGNSGNDAGACFAFVNGADGAIFRNCEFDNNTANNTGGGICTAGGSPTVIDCVFQNNNAALGGGIYINNGDTATVSNTILCGNSPDQYSGPGTFDDQGGNQISGSCDFADCNANGVPDGDELDGNDCNANGTIDECELSGNDCDGNGALDECDLAGGAEDSDANGVLDVCQPACEFNTACDGGDAVYPADQGALVGTGGVACSSAGISTENTFLNVYDANTVNPDGYKLSCVAVPVYNSGSFMEATVQVVSIPDPLIPSINSMVVLGEGTVCMESAVAGVAELTFDAPIAIDAGSAFGILLDVPPSADGFASYEVTSTADGAATYILSASCGLTDFTGFPGIGFPDPEWTIQMSFVADDEPCTGDLDGDGTVGFSDLQLILSAWNDSDGGDANGDGETNFSDLQVILSAWGGC